MLNRRPWLIVLLVAMVAFWGCSDDDDDGPVGPPAATWTDLATTAGTLINDSSLTPGVMSAEAVHTLLDTDPDDYAVIDFRSEADYNAGHIPGAYHSSLATLLDDLENEIPQGRTYIVYCYTGQTVGHAQVAMQLLGYTPVKSIKWGAAAWNSTLAGRWNSGIGNTLPDPETTNQNANLVEHDFPTPTGSLDIRTRVEVMLQGGFKNITYTNMLADFDDYFVVNYHSLPVYLGQDAVSGVPGHIPGAFQFTPNQSLGIDQMLNNLPTDKKIVLYCWTGTGSSHLAAYLNMLGYDAYSLLYGVNNLFHDTLVDGYANKWDSATMSFNYPLEPTTR